MPISDYISTDDPAGTLAAQREAAVAAAVAEVNAQYDAEFANLKANEELVGKQRGLAIADLMQQRGRDYRRQDDETVKRGILRSGIYARDRAELENAYDRSSASTNMQYDEPLYALQQALATLEARRAAGLAGTQAEVDAQYLEIARALADLGYLNPTTAADAGGAGGSPSPAPPAAGTTERRDPSTAEKMNLPLVTSGPQIAPPPNPTYYQTSVPRTPVTQPVSRDQNDWDLKRALSENLIRSTTSNPVVRRTIASSTTGTTRGIN